MSQSNQLCWLAGIIEGEGNVGIYRYKRKFDKKGNLLNDAYKLAPKISITNNDPNIINQCDKMIKRLGVNMCLHTRDNQTKEGYAPTYILTSTGYSDIYIILSNVATYMFGNKRAISQLMIRFISSRKLGKTREKYTSVEEKIYNQVRDLTKTGIAKELLPSETKRDTLIKSDDIVRTSAKSEEIGRNVLSVPINGIVTN